MTAAPTMICPSVDFRWPNSDSTLEVMPMLVAVNAAPAKMAGITGAWKSITKPTVPKAKGAATPITATTAAW